MNHRRFVAVVGGALALSRYPSALLFQVGVRDPLTRGRVVLLLGVVAGAALHAVRVDPMLALRSE